MKMKNRSKHHHTVSGKRFAPTPLSEGGREKGKLGSRRATPIIRYSIRAVLDLDVAAGTCRSYCCVAETRP